MKKRKYAVTGVLAPAHADCEAERKVFKGICCPLGMKNPFLNRKGMHYLLLNSLLIVFNCFCCCLTCFLRFLPLELYILTM